MASFAQMCEDLLRNQLVDMLGRIAEGEGLELEVLMSKYLPATGPIKTPIKAAKIVVKKEDTVKCTATTAKGKPCSLNALGGGCLCRVHSKAPKEPKAKEPKAPKEPKKPAKKKAKKTEQPAHSHSLDEMVHADCELCQSHGSPLEDTDVDEEFETIASPKMQLKERLNKVVKDAYEDEDVEEM